MLPRFGLKDETGVIVTNLSLLMYETGWDIFTVKRMPIPTFLLMSEELAKHAEKMERNMKKRKR